METQPMTLQQIENYIFEKLPEVLEKNPRFVVMIEGIIAEKFPRRDEFARLLDEVRDLRLQSDRQFNELRFEMEQQFKRVDQRLEQVDQRLEQVDRRVDRVEARMDGIEQKMTDGFREVHERFHDMEVHIDRLGSRWGIRNEKLFRQTMKEVLEKSFGMTVNECVIAGEQFDCLISDGQHILIEISASADQNILERLRRKRQMYIEETGITPHRFILAVGSIHSRRAEVLRAEGFEVIEPEE